MENTVYQILMLIGGMALVWLGAWNIKKDDEQDRQGSTPRYVSLMLIGFIGAVAGLLYLLRDLINLF